MLFYVTDFKAEHVRRMAVNLLEQVILSSRFVAVDTLASVFLTCVSLALAMPWFRF